jgi:hypothetical protein
MDTATRPDGTLRARVSAALAAMGRCEIAPSRRTKASCLRNVPRHVAHMIGRSGLAL